MLKYIDDVCTKNGIKYWLSSGTLLGAVRHGGFIPWDDDLDIEMLRSDYKKFVRAIQSSPNPNYALQSHKTDFFYLNPYPKLRDLNSEMKEIGIVIDEFYKYKGVFIDIFIMDPSSSLCLFKIGRYLQNKIITPIILQKSFKKINKSLVYFKYKLLNSFLLPILRQFCKINSGNNLRYCLGIDWLGIRRKDEIFPLKRIKFEDAEFFVPNNSDAYLTRVYGNYMQLPNIEKVHVHTIDIKFK